MSNAEEVPHTYDNAMTDPTLTGCVCGYGGERSKTRISLVQGLLLFSMSQKETWKYVPVTIESKNDIE